METDLHNLYLNFAVLQKNKGIIDEKFWKEFIGSRLVNCCWLSPAIILGSGSLTTPGVVQPTGKNNRIIFF
jgi:hypothetical protein